MDFNIQASSGIISMTGYADRSFFFFQAEDGIRDLYVTGVQTCGLPIYGDDATTDPLIAGVLDHPVAWAEVCVLAKHQRRRRWIDRQHGQLPWIGIRRQREQVRRRQKEPLAPSAMSKRHEHAIAGLEPLDALPYGEDPGDALVACSRGQR